jgi:WD40 repeat protein
VVFSRDGSRLASVGVADDGKAPSGQVKVWDVVAGKELQSLPGYTEETASVLFSPDGSRLALLAPGQTVRVWDVSTGQPVPNLSPGGGRVEAGKEIACVAFSPDQRTVAIADRTGLWLRPSTLKVKKGVPGLSKEIRLLGPENQVTGVAFSPEGQRLFVVVEGKGISIWNVAFPKPVANLGGPKYDLRSLAATPDGRRLATVGLAKDVKIWEPTTGRELLALRDHPAAVTSVAFSPNGRFLASADAAGNVRLWEAPVGPAVPPLEVR